jgi:SAM-dependent methyltransferase
MGRIAAPAKEVAAEPAMTTLIFMTAHGRRSAAGSGRGGAQHPSQAWQELAVDYEQARAREDSLDRLVEWPAERDILGDVTGRSILDLGCGNGGKLAQLVREGAVASAGVDIGGNFITSPPAGVELIQGDLSDPDSLPELSRQVLTAPGSASPS